MKESALNEHKDGAKYDLEERLLEYAVRVIRLTDSLYKTRSGNHVGGQLVRSATSPLSNHGEAQAAESLDDFIHKLKIALKELQESWRWLRLIRRVPLIAKPVRADPLIQETEELVRIFAKSVRTAAAKRDNRLQEEPGEDDPWVIRPPLEFGVWSLEFGVLPPSPQKPVSYREVAKKPGKR